MDEEKHNSEEMDEESFAKLLEKSLVTRRNLVPGEQVEATVLKIASDWVFLDVGQKGEGVLDIKELLNADGELTVAEGDRINTYFLSRTGGELRFTTRLGGGDSGTAQLEDAWRSGVPVEGRIEKEIKGGYEIRLSGGARAFCPFSQIGVQRTASADEVLGTSLPFKITQFGERGRNIVVSRRVILEAEREKAREALRETLNEGDIVHGTVTSVRDFGAFIDIGGIEGLIPVSEITWGRVEDIHQVISTGQELNVAVKSLDWDQNRFSFSLRETLADPWGKVQLNYPAGSTHTGTVSRLAPFGAFVRLEEGVDGLIHISKLGKGERIRHPQDVVKIGQSITVSIEKVDPDQRRISLVPKEEDVEEGPTSYEDRPSSGMGTFADLLKAGKDNKRR